MATVDLELNAEVSKASKEVSKFADDANKAIDGVSSAFNALAAVAVAALGAIGFKKLIDAAIESENSILKLNTSLALTGELTPETSQKFQNFAAEMQKTSSASEETILSLVALSKSMGATNEQTEKVIKAAADMSAVTGDSLESSVEKLNKTLGGSIGLLGKTEPAVRGLTEEQLRAGAAIDKVAEKYKGAAESLTNNFGGSLHQVKNSVGEVGESLGKLVTGSPVVIGAMKTLASIFDGLAAFIDKNRDKINDLVGNAIKSLVDAIPYVVKGFGLIAGGVQVVNTGIDAMTLLFIKVARIALEATQAIAAPLEFLGKMATRGRGGDVNIDLTKTIELLKSMENISSQKLSKSVDAIGEVANSFENAAKNSESFSTALDKNTLEAKNAKKVLEDLSKTNKGLGKNTQSITIDTKKYSEELKTVAAEAAKLREAQAADQAKMVGQVGGGLANILQGEAGAKTLIASSAGAAAEQFLPGAGAAVTQITEALAQGPEHVKMMVEQFATAIPKIIDNIIQALPVLVDALAEHFPDMVERLAFVIAEKGPSIAVALSKTFSDPNFIGALIAAFAKGILGGFGEAITGMSVEARKIGGQIAEGFQTFFSFFTDAFSGFGVKIFDGFKFGLDSLGTFFEDLGGKIASGFKNAMTSLGDVTSGGDGGYIGQVYDRVKNAKVPGMEGLGLTEDGGGAILLRILSLLENPITVNSSVKLNEKEFANIMLNLSRQNARTS
jgi:hypothetical protein